MPLLWISFAFIAGALVSLFSSIAWLIAAIVGGAFAVLAIVEKRIFLRFRTYTFARKKLISPLFLLAAAFCGGLVRGEMGKPVFNSGDLGWYNGQPQIILRAVASQPAENHDSSTMLTVSAQEISVDGNQFFPVKGEAVILLPAGKEFDYGDRLEITGSLETPPERADFSYKQYLENRGVYSYLSYPKINLMEKNSGNPMLTAIYHLRNWIVDTSDQIMPQPEAAFLSGLLVGRDEDIPDGLKNAFKNTGTSHLVAISGFNITILSGLILALTNRLFTRRWSVITSILLISAYAVMAGASPSVVRAAIMGALAIVARSIGRNRTAVNSLGLAAGIMALQNPLILRDIGFQLSVVATAGILVIGAPINDRFVVSMTGPDKTPEINLVWRSLGDFIVITLAAQAATLPVLLYHFHQYPLIGLLVNPLVLPVQSAAMVLGGLATVAGMIWLPFGKILGLAAWVPLAYTTRVVELFSGLHGIGLINVHLELWQAGALGFALILAVLFQKMWVKRIIKFAFPAAGLSLIVILMLLINALYFSPDGRMHILVYRQGKDISTFIQSPAGQHLLVTNRPGDKDLTGFVDRHLPIVGKRLDAIILPNPSASSSIGLQDSISHFAPEWLLINSEAGGYRVQSKLKDAAEGQSSKNQPLAAQMQLDLGAGAILSIIWADEKGCNLAIDWGNHKSTIQYGSSTENNTSGLLPSGLMNVLILDHADGMKTGQSAEFVLDADSLPQGTVNRFVVPDGSWLEIRSDGRTTEILEKIDGTS